MASSWTNKQKQGVSANLFSAVVKIFELSLPFQYVNPTPASWSNKSKS